ncbi:MAG TPA: NPCBM/NEW2 domain-containing protein [Phycisphaerae bacterium]|nr:NPCBM/NEW2 domain-containing protein [Phycisphaerae bacterium]
MLSSRLLPAILIASVLAHAAAARADWTLTSADFSEQGKLTVNTWDATGLSVTGQSGNLVRIPTRDVVSLVSDLPVAPPNKSWCLALRNGDLLYGEPADIAGQSLEFKTDFGTIAVALKDLQSLTTSAPAPAVPAPASSDKDVVRLSNGDSMSGIIASIDPDKVQISTDAAAGNVTDIALNLVKQIYFAGATSPRTIPPLSARLTFASGCRLTVPATGFTWTISDVSFQDPSGQLHKIAASQLAGVEILGGRVVYVTDLDPAKDEQNSFIGGSWPSQINRNVLGGPLVVGRTTYPRGIGVHTRSFLAYDLDGSFDTLKLQVGMDDSAAPRGEADVSIVLDGKTIWHQHLTCGAASGILSEPLSLPVAGGKHLEFHAEPAQGSGNLDVLGRVDWLNIALVRH